VGVEVEAIALDADSGAPVAPWTESGRATVAVLDVLADRHRWGRGLSASGAPAYQVPSGGKWSFEPGGQLEYSSPPFTSVDALLQDVRDTVTAVAQEAARQGIRLVARGVDPLNAPERAPLRLQSDRYARMAAHFGRLSPAGHIMMCQTAAVHVNVDPVAPPDVSWQLANAMAPVLLATFANSRCHAGAATGARSWRGEQWRQLDPGRTGVFRAAADPVEQYLSFALEAPAFLLGEAREARPFRHWLERGASLEAFAGHLTTLFPEVRPRGYLELRCYDALPLSFLPAAVVLTVGLLQQPQALSAALAALPEPSAETLSLAGRAGLSDPKMALLARTLCQLGLEGGQRLGRSVIGGPSLEAAQRFFEDFTSCGRDPGDHPRDDWV
jgi:glutamate--cysteine ligase